MPPLKGEDFPRRGEMSAQRTERGVEVAERSEVGGVSRVRRADDIRPYRFNSAFRIIPRDACDACDAEGVKNETG